jgi:hypothetical protein
MNSGEVTGSGRVEVADYFQRLCDVEKDTAQKSLLLLELGELRIATNNEEAARVCLIESVALDPRNTRAFTLLGRLFRSATGRDHGAYAQALARLIQLGGNYGHADAIWFATLGQLEVNHLSRTTEGLANLKRAVQLDPSLFETRIEIAKTLFRLGGPDEALIELFRLVHPDATPLLSLPDFGGGLGLLEEVLTAAKRPEEAIVINEWRALGGVLDDGRHAWLRARRVNQTDNNTVPLDRAMLIHQVLPPEGRHALLEVAVATTGIEAKLFRADLAEHGISAKDRITGRGAPFTKTLLDRICRSLGVTEVELAISPTVERPRILAQDVPWIVVPRSLVESSEPVQIAALARCVARIALGTPWIEELDPLNVEAFLIACARQVVPTYGDETVDMMAAKLVAQYEPAVAKSLTRRHKKFLEDLAPHLAMPQHAPLAMDIFMGAIARAELRTAFILGGDLLATVDEIRALDPNLRRDSNNPSRNALEHILAHPYSGDICRFALSPEATALRRRVGSTWVKG